MTVTRIDLQIVPQGLFVKQYNDGWTASSRADEIHTNVSWTLDQAVAWLEREGWIVRRWPGGARAWKGKMMPVRNSAGIKKKRDHLTQNRAMYPDLQINALDLAFDL